MKMDTITRDYKATIEKIDNLNQQADEARNSNTSLALELSKEAVNFAQNTEYKQGLAKAYLNAGICYRLTSNFESAFLNYEEALKLYKEANDTKGVTRTLNSIANTHLHLSNFTKAIEYFDECIYLLQSIGDIEFEATVLSNRGLAHQQYGDFNESLRNYLQSLSMHDGAKKKIPYYLYNNIGIVYLEIESYSTAIKYFNCALKIEQTEGKALEESYTIANIGRTYFYMGDFVNAVTYLSEALIIMKKFGDRQAESQVFSNLGKAYMKLRCFPESIILLNKAIKYYKEIGDKSSVAHTLCELGELYHELKDYSSSREYFNEALALSIETNDEINKVRTYMGLSKLYVKFMDIVKVQDYLSLAIQLAEKRQSYKELGRIYRIYYDCYKLAGLNSEAKIYFEKHTECINKLMQFEEESYFNTFTANHNFEVKFNSQDSVDELSKNYNLNGNGKDIKTAIKQGIAL
jgi:tetratricopeptide (TPR) repeat protein